MEFRRRAERPGAGDVVAGGVLYRLCMLTRLQLAGYYASGDTCSHQSIEEQSAGDAGGMAGLLCPCEAREASRAYLPRPQQTVHLAQDSRTILHRDGEGGAPQRPKASAQFFLVCIKSVHKLFLVQQLPTAPCFLDAKFPKLLPIRHFCPIDLYFHAAGNPSEGGCSGCIDTASIGETGGTAWAVAEEEC